MIEPHMSGMEWAFTALMLLPLLLFAACALYLWRLLLNAVPSRGRVVSMTPPVPSNVGTKEVAPQIRSAAFADTRFVVLLPAHNEELLLGAALNGLNALDYPREAFAVVVIADNCTDQTAQIARDHGALALERFDDRRVGKGYALEDALNWLMPLTPGARQTAPNLAGQENALQRHALRSSGEPEPTATRLLPGPDTADTRQAWELARGFDAVVILDADTFVSRNLLTAFADGLEAGQTAMQARYDVLNAGDSWRTRLMQCALALAHVVKPLGRERLGLSDGLKGNGMCFARSVVEQIPWSGESITEDIEYALRLCRAQHRIAFMPHACVWAQMPTTGAQAVTQRKRWEGGRYRLLFTVAPALLRESLQTGNRLLRDRAVELVVPPFAEMFALPVLLGGICALASWSFHWRSATALTLAWAFILLMQAGYLCGGMWVARIPARTALSLLCAPFYIVWKLGVYAVMAVSRSTGGWKRTERHELSK